MNRVDERHSLRHPLNSALVVLTFTTGIVDAVSYLGLGHVFTANMTGNIVFLGFGIAGAGGLPVVAPLVSLAAFLLGAHLGGRMVTRIGGPDRRQLARALAVESGALLVATALAIVLTIHADALSGYVLIALLAGAMGVRNATVRGVGAPDLTTTVLTMTLTGLAADLAATGGAGEGSARRLAAVAAMLAGAVAGALLLKTDLALPLALATVLAGAAWRVALRQVP